GEAHDPTSRQHRGAHRVDDSGRPVTLVEVGPAGEHEGRDAVDVERGDRVAMTGRGRRWDPVEVVDGDRAGGRSESVDSGGPPGAEHDRHGVPTESVADLAGGAPGPGEGVVGARARRGHRRILALAPAGTRYGSVDRPR